MNDRVISVSTVFTLPAYAKGSGEQESIFPDMAILREDGKLAYRYRNRIVGYSLLDLARAMREHLQSADEKDRLTCGTQLLYLVRYLVANSYLLREDEPLGSFLQRFYPFMENAAPGFLVSAFHVLDLTFQLFDLSSSIAELLLSPMPLELIQKDWDEARKACFCKLQEEHILLYRMEKGKPTPYGCLALRSNAWISIPLPSVGSEGKLSARLVPAYELPYTALERITVKMRKEDEKKLAKTLEQRVGYATSRDWVPLLYNAIPVQEQETYENLLKTVESSGTKRVAKEFTPLIHNYIQQRVVCPSGENVRSDLQL